MGLMKKLILKLLVINMCILGVFPFYYY